MKKFSLLLKSPKFWQKYVQIPSKKWKWLLGGLFLEWLSFSKKPKKYNPNIEISTLYTKHTTSFIFHNTSGRTIYLPKVSSLFDHYYNLGPQVNKELSLRADQHRKPEYI